jgi:hypothetical protein
VPGSVGSGPYVRIGPCESALHASASRACIAHGCIACLYAESASVARSKLCRVPQHCPVVCESESERLVIGRETNAAQPQFGVRCGLQ